MAHTVIQDQIGRTIVGKVVEETDQVLVLNNPVILHCQLAQNGGLQVDTFPAFFFEFIDKANREKNDWTYNKANIVTSNVVLDEKVVQQYEKINAPAQPVASKNTNPKVISLDL